MAIKLEKLVTSKGVAQYPHLITPDTKFNELGEFKVNLILGEAEAKPVMMQIDKALEKSKASASEKSKGKPVKTADAPYYPFVDTDGNATGSVVFKFKAKHTVVTKSGDTFTNRVVIVDAKGKPFTPNAVWGGTEMKVSAEIVPYWTAMVGAGVSLRLKAVQIINLVEGKESQASGYGFGIEEGFEAEVVTPSAPASDFNEETADF